MTAELDLSGIYTVGSMPGVAFRLVGWATGVSEEAYDLDCADDHEHDEWCYLYSEPEIYERDDMVRAVMVGDDREHLVDVDDLSPLDRDGYCLECGQTSCTAARETD